LELAAERHWNGFEQLIPWAALAVAFIALILRVVWPAAATLTAVRLLTVLVIAAGAVGVWRHVVANYHAGPLDARYTFTWEAMSEPERWWKAATGGVGPAAILASGVLTQAGLLIFASTLGHPAFTQEAAATEEARQQPVGR
jgi:hypothetical protein